MKPKVKTVVKKKFWVVQIMHDDDWHVLLEKKGRAELRDFFAVFLTEKAARDYVREELHYGDFTDKDDWKENVEWRVRVCTLDIQ